MHHPYLKPLSINIYPEGFKERFIRCSKGLYPQEELERIKARGQNPIIVGYVHALHTIREIRHVMDTFRAQRSGASLKIAHEISPESLGWIKDFLRHESEFRQFGTVQGKALSQSQTEDLKRYRNMLSQGHSANLALWMLEQGHEVTSLEHADVRAWASADAAKVPGIFRLPYTAIKRDIHAISVIATQEPDIITCGFAHALKLDLLLNRTGAGCFYILQGPCEWDVIITAWESAHDAYRKDVGRNGSAQP